jgi:fanconi anemia group I protein
MIFFHSKEGMDVVTPGIVGLSFSLVKAKKKRQLNKLGSYFLQKFLKKRFIFGQGVIKTLSEFLFADHESIALEECLTELSLSNTLTMSECLGTLEQIMEYMLLIKGEQSMRIMSFILPIVKISQPIRDFFIEVLRKAMYQR